MFRNRKDIIIIGGPSTIISLLRLLDYLKRKQVIHLMIWKELTKELSINSGTHKNQPKMTKPLRMLVFIITT